MSMEYRASVYSKPQNKSSNFKNFYKWDDQKLQDFTTVRSKEDEDVLVGKPANSYDQNSRRANTAICN